MKIKQLINELEEVQGEHGNLEITTSPEPHLQVQIDKELEKVFL